MINYKLIRELLDLMEWLHNNNYLWPAAECKGCLENYLDFSFSHIDDEYVENFIKEKKQKILNYK